MFQLLAHLLFIKTEKKTGNYFFICFYCRNKCAVRRMSCPWGSKAPFLNLDASVLAHLAVLWLHFGKNLKKKKSLLYFTLFQVKLYLKMFNFLSWKRVKREKNMKLKIKCDSYKNDTWNQRSEGKPGTFDPELQSTEKELPGKETNVKNLKLDWRTGLFSLEVTATNWKTHRNLHKIERVQKIYNHNQTFVDLWPQ